MANIWKPSGSSYITSATLGNLLSKKITVEIDDVVWGSEGGYLVSQAASSNREFGLWFGSGQVVIKAGNNDEYLGTITSLVGSSTLVAGTLVLEYDFVSGDYDLLVDSVSIASGNFASGGLRSDGALFRIGARGSDTIPGSTASTYLLGSGDRVGNTRVYLDDVLTRSYIMPAAGTSIPETTSLQVGTLGSPSGDDWEAGAAPSSLDAPTIDYPIYAIGNDAKCKYEFSGTYSDVVPTLIQYRVMQGATEILTWTSVDSFGSGEYAFTPDVSPGTGFTIEVRTTVASVTYENTSSSFDVGPIIGIIGSSSAERMFTLNSETTLGRVHVKSLVWGTTDNAVMTGKSAVVMANRIYAATSGWPVGFYNAGEGGTWLTTDWNPVDGANYAAFVSQVNESNITMIYNQAGYNDCDNSVTLVEDDVTDVIDALRLLYGNIPYIDGLSQRGRVDRTTLYQSIFWTVGSAVQAAYNDYYINWRLDLEIGVADGTHLSEDASALSAERAGSIAAYICGASVAYQGPGISSATYSGSTVTVNLDTTGTDYTELDPDTLIAGFLVTDNTGERTLTAQVSPNKTTITLTADSALVGPVSLQFAAYKINVPNTKAFPNYPLTDGDVEFPVQPLTSPETVTETGLTPSVTAPEITTIGSNTHSVTGFSGTITSGKIKSGTAEIEFSSANDTTAVIPAIANLGDAVPFGDIDYILSDGTDTATGSSTFEVPSGFKLLTLAGTLDYSEDGILHNWGTTPLAGTQIIHDDALTVPATGGPATGPYGTYTNNYAIHVTEDQPVYEQFDITITDVVETEPELAGTRTINATVGQSLSKTLTTVGGSAPTSWDITGGADELSYTLSDTGLLTRLANDTEETEVITVTASNAEGDSDEQTISIVWQEYTPSSRVKSIESKSMISKSITSRII